MFFKKAVLVVHGFGGSTYDNELLVNYLEYNTNYDVYDFTLPGHQKLQLKNIKYNEWIEEAEKQVEHLIKKYKTIYVVGHSMGGVISAHLASKYKQIKKVVFIAAAFEYGSYKQNGKDLLNILETSKEELPNAYDVMLAKFFLVPLPTIIQFTRLVKHYRKDIEKVEIPTLILHGSKDEVVPISAANYAFEHSGANKKYKTLLEGVRHAVLRSRKTDDICEYIRLFLKGGRKWKKNYKSIL